MHHTVRVRATTITSICKNWSENWLSILPVTFFHFTLPSRSLPVSTSASSQMSCLTRLNRFKCRRVWRHAIGAVWIVYQCSSLFFLGYLIHCVGQGIVTGVHATLMLLLLLGTYKWAIAISHSNADVLRIGRWIQCLLVRIYRSSPRVQTSFVVDLWTVWLRRSICCKSCILLCCSECMGISRSSPCILNVLKGTFSKIKSHLPCLRFVVVSKAWLIIIERSRVTNCSDKFFKKLWFFSRKLIKVVNLKSGLCIRVLTRVVKMLSDILYNFVVARVIIIRMCIDIFNAFHYV